MNKLPSERSRQREENPMYAAEREESRNARDSLTELERAYDPRDYR